MSCTLRSPHRPRPLFSSQSTFAARGRHGDDPIEEGRLLSIAGTTAEADRVTEETDVHAAVKNCCFLRLPRRRQRQRQPRHHPIPSRPPHRN